MDIGIVKEKLLDLVFPKKCVVCGRWEDFVCNACLPEVVFKREQECPGCNKVSKQGRYCLICRRKASVKGILSATYYKDPIVKALIWEFKYGGITAEAELFVEWLAVLIEKEGVGADVLTFVPMSKKKKRARGYNQAEVLANALGRKLGLPVSVLLQKTRETKAQVGLAKKEREKNLEGAFSQAKDCCGKRVIILDDVATTGTTLNECAKVLYGAGAKEVWGVVIAKE